MTSRDERRLRELEDRYRHDGSITDEERQELRDCILRIKGEPNL